MRGSDEGPQFLEIGKIERQKLPHRSAAGAALRYQQTQSAFQGPPGLSQLPEFL